MYNLNGTCLTNPRHSAKSLSKKCIAFQNNGPQVMLKIKYAFEFTRM